MDDDAWRTVRAGIGLTGLTGATAAEPSERPYRRRRVSLLRDVVTRLVLEAMARRTDWPRRLLLCHYGARLGSLGLNAGTTGNLSVRLRDGASIFITPRGVDKSRLEPRQIRRLSLTDDDPRVTVASSELPLHRESYLARPDVGAVIHAHPPALTALPLRNLNLAATLPESGAALGGIARLRYAPAGSETLARLVGDAVRSGSALLLLEHHGVVAVGGTLGEACGRIEQGELAALTTLMAAGEAIWPDRPQDTPAPGTPDTTVADGAPQK